MGSIETLALIPLGSIDLIGAGAVDAITNTLNVLGIVFDGLFS
ncbi:hypothetical protein [Rhodococcus pyridinivorans]|nr:hypothetical protein [Rhodococcus pyridinivorans]